MVDWIQISAVANQTHVCICFALQYSVVTKTQAGNLSTGGCVYVARLTNALVALIAVFGVRVPQMASFPSWLQIDGRTVHPSARYTA